MLRDENGWDAVRYNLRRNFLASLRANRFPGRRECRRLVRAIQYSRAFERIFHAMKLEHMEAAARADNGPLPMFPELRAHIFFFQTHEAVCSREEDLRARATEVKEAIARAKVAKETLRQYLELGPHEYLLDRQCSHAEVQQHRDLLERVADDIYRIAVMGPESWGCLWYDKLVGQGGDHRAFMIRRLDRMLPAQTVNRFAAIAELLRISGYAKTTPQLVRATIKKGHT